MLPPSYAAALLLIIFAIRHAIYLRHLRRYFAIIFAMIIFLRYFAVFRFLHFFFFAFSFSLLIICCRQYYSLPCHFAARLRAISHFSDIYFLLLYFLRRRFVYILMNTFTLMPRLSRQPSCH